MNTLEGLLYLGMVTPLISDPMSCSVNLIKEDRFPPAVDNCLDRALDVKISELYEAGEG
jgi:hypothetical protein